MVLRIIGITGGIGAGKSIVSRVLRCKGFAVYDCDMEARKLMENSLELKQEIKKVLGNICIGTDGSLNRSKIAELVFNDASKRLWLNSRVHVMVRQHITRCAENKKCQSENVAVKQSLNDSLFFVESAILNTGGITPMCDCVWVVDASDGTRLKRVCSRDGVSENQVRLRMESQASEFVEFGDRPVISIQNDDVSSLLDRIDQALGETEKLFSK